MNEASTHINRRLLVYTTLGIIILASVVGNLYWIAVNIVQLGDDASSHLTRTLKIAAELQQPSFGALLRSLTITDFRPPAPYVVVQPFYWIFGQSMDSAQLANIFLMAAVLVFTFLLGRRAVNTRVALLATAITALLPMLVAMSRLFYTEALVTLCVVANLYFLVKSEGFSRRGWAIAWGLSLGIGLLAKWTLPVYLIFPTLIVLWQVRIWRAWGLKQWPKWRSVALAALAAAALAALLYWPERITWEQTLLGPWLALAWFGVWFLFFCLWITPASPATNFMTALASALALASIWYLPQAGFVFELSDVAWGTDYGAYKPADWDSPSHYYRYFRLFLRNHLGLAAALAILPAGLLPWLWHGRAWLRQFPATLPLWSAALAPFIVLIFTSQTSNRNLVAILPFFAILVCTGLLAYSLRWRTLIAVLWLGILLVQYAFLTFDGFAGLHARSYPLWVQQNYSAAPASGFTDPGYWIVPDVLASIEATTPTTTTLGVLIDTAQLHPGSFEYPLMLAHAPVDMTTLTGTDLRRAGDVIANQWILLKDGDNGEMRNLSQDLAADMLAGAPWFHRLFTLAREYPLPNGETAYLYHRTAGPTAPHEFSTVLGEDLPPITAAVQQWWSDHATLAFTTGDAAVWMGTQPVPIEDAIMPAGGGDLQPPDLTDVQDTLIVVSRYHTPLFQEWLNQDFRYMQEVNSGEFAALLYTRPEGALETVAVAADWPDVTLESLQTRGTLAPGQGLPVDLTFAGRLDGSRKVSVRLIAPDGTQVTQQDVDVAEGTRALALFVPPGAVPGMYALQLLVYDATTLEPIADNQQRTQVPVAGVRVDIAD